MFTYAAYKLAIASELAIPEFVESAPLPADITIHLCDVPDTLENPATIFANWQAKPDEFLIEIEKIGRYLVQGGHTIHIERFAGASDQDVRNFLLGSAMAAAIQQRRILPLHASAIESPNGAVLFLGKSGHGKSTLMSQFAHRGHKMIADDITAVDLQNDVAMALPSFPSTRLTQTSLNALKLENTFTQVGSSVQKFRVPVPQIATEPAPIHAIVFLEFGTSRTPQLRTLDSKIALKEIMRLTFRANFMRAMGLGDVQFKNATKIIKTAKAYQLDRVGNEPSFDEVAALISDTLGL